MLEVKGKLLKMINQIAKQLIKKLRIMLVDLAIVITAISIVIATMIQSQQLNSPEAKQMAILSVALLIIEKFLKKLESILSKQSDKKGSHVDWKKSKEQEPM